MWFLGDTILSAEMIRFLFMSMSLLAVLCAGLYNMTVGNVDTRAVWGPIVASCFFAILPAPIAPPVIKRLGVGGGTGGSPAATNLFSKRV